MLLPALTPVAVLSCVAGGAVQRLRLDSGRAYELRSSVDVFVSASMSGTPGATDTRLRADTPLAFVADSSGGISCAAATGSDAVVVVRELRPAAPCACRSGGSNVCR